MGRYESVDSYRQTYQNGENLVSGWQSWYPRYLPIVGCGIPAEGPYIALDHPCNRQRREFPAIFSNLLNLRINPSVRGIWWWHSMENSTSNTAVDSSSPIRTQIQEEVRPNLFRLVEVIATFGAPEPPNMP